MGIVFQSTAKNNLDHIQDNIQAEDSSSSSANREDVDHKAIIAQNPSLDIDSESTNKSKNKDIQSSVSVREKNILHANGGGEIEIAARDSGKSESVPNSMAQESLYVNSSSNPSDIDVETDKTTNKNDQMQASKSTSEDGALILNSAPDAGVGSTEDGAGITNTTGEVASPTTAEKQRSKRIKTTKRRYYDEEWISVKRKKARLESLNMSSEHQYSSSICSKRQNSSEVSVPPAEVTSLPQATPTVSNPASPDPRNISND